MAQNIVSVQPGYLCPRISANVGEGQGEGNPMHTKITRRTFCSMLLALPFPAQAQQPTKIPRIGYLATNSLSVISARVEAFRQGLRELGYVEGKNIVIEWRYAEGKLDRLPALAAELVAKQIGRAHV